MVWKGGCHTLFFLSYQQRDFSSCLLTNYRIEFESNSVGATGKGTNIIHHLNRKERKWLSLLSPNGKFIDSYHLRSTGGQDQIVPFIFNASTKLPRGLAHLLTQFVAEMPMMTCEVRAQEWTAGQLDAWKVGHLVSGWPGVWEGSPVAQIGN